MRQREDCRESSKAVSVRIGFLWVSAFFANWHEATRTLPLLLYLHPYHIQVMTVKLLTHDSLPSPHPHGLHTSDCSHTALPNNVLNKHTVEHTINNTLHGTTPISLGQGSIRHPRKEFSHHQHARCLWWKLRNWT